MTPTPPAFVFLHGLLGFERMGVGIFSVPYFRGLPEWCAGRGEDAHFPALPPVGDIEERAAQVAAYLGGLTTDEIHLIGHSMGGLDARAVASHLDPQGRIRSVITLGTPHRGSALASWLMATQGPFQWVVRPWARRAIEDLLPASCERFNQATPDRPDVRYRSVGASRPAEEVPLWAQSWWRTLHDEGGANDAQVTLESARWGESFEAVEADHWELAGWNLAPLSRRASFDHLPLYERLVAQCLGADR